MSDMVAAALAHVSDLFAGPLHARLIVQPFAATMLALIDGLHDADAHRPPYLWSLLRRSGRQRRRAPASTPASVAKVLALALSLDLAHQFIAVGAVDVGDALLIAVVLAVAPYVLFRGVVTRFATDPADPI